MERKTLFRLAITAAIVTEATVACFPGQTTATDISPTNTVHPPTPTYVSPTSLPNFRDYLATATVIPSPTETPVPTLTVEQKFLMGPFDAATTPFTLQSSEDLNRLMGYIPASNKVLTADIPMPIKVATFGTDEQFEIFEKAITDNSEGNPYYVITTDQPNHLFFLFHSITQTSVGDEARKVTSFAILHPDKKDSLIGQQVVMTLGDNPPTIAEIVNFNVVSAEYFDNMGVDSPWGIYPKGDNILFARTDAFGIPPEIRNDAEYGTYYMTIVACQSESGRISLLYNENVKNRALLTLRIKIP